MVLELPTNTARPTALRSRGMRSLRDLPPRRPAQPAPEDSSVRWERIDVGRYEVRADGTIVGFVDVVGAVFVALAGPRYDRALEVQQTLDFATAVRAVTPSAS